MWKGNSKLESKVDVLLEHFDEALRGIAVDFEGRESEALALGNELVRRWIERELGRISRGFGAEVTVDGDHYRQHQEGTCKYHTLCGPILVRRASYRRVGVHNGPTVVPLDLHAGLQQRATPALAFSVTQGFADGPLRQYEATMHAAHRSVPSRSALERIGKRIGEAIQAIVMTVEPELRAAEPQVATAHSISVGLDRTTVPMAELIEGATPPPRDPPRVRQPPAPVAVAYRMAYVGTVSVHDDQGTVLVTKRFAATPTEGPEELASRVGAELRHLLSRYGCLPVTVVQDGAPELWKLVAELCSREGIRPTFEVIDRFHVNERLAQITDLVACSDKMVYELRAAWQTYLDRSDTAIDRIVRRLDELMDSVAYLAEINDPRPPFWKSRARLRLSGESQGIISGHLEYFRRNRSRIRYATSLRRGCPIGSGPTEGACKSLVTMRFKRSGQRWFESGLSPCLSLRALHLSERLRPCFAKVQATRFASLEAT